MGVLGCLDAKTPTPTSRQRNDLHRMWGVVCGCTAKLRMIGRLGWGGLGRLGGRAADWTG